MNNYNYTYKLLRAEINNSISTMESYHNIPSDTFRLKLNHNTWNCAEICQHLVQFNRVYIKHMQEAVQKKSKSDTGKEPFQPRFVFRLFTSWLEPPYKMKIKTISPLYPGNSNTTPDNVVDILIKTNKQLLVLIDHAENGKWDLNSITGSNPLLKFIPMTLVEMLAFFLAHQRRHFWQIERLLDKFGY